MKISEDRAYLVHVKGTTRKASMPGISLVK